MQAFPGSSLDRLQYILARVLRTVKAGGGEALGCFQLRLLTLIAITIQELCSVRGLVKFVKRQNWWVGM